MDVRHAASPAPGKSTLVDGRPSIAASGAPRDSRDAAARRRIARLTGHDARSTASSRSTQSADRPHTAALDPRVARRLRDEIRRLFARTPACARAAATRRAGSPSTSPKVARCDACAVKGASGVQMSFLPETSIACEQCERIGASPTRRSPVTYAGRVDRGGARSHRRGSGGGVRRQCPRSRVRSACSAEIGLGYLTLGQPSNTLSRRRGAADQARRPSSGGSGSGRTHRSCSTSRRRACTIGGRRAL